MNISKNKDWLGERVVSAKGIEGIVVGFENENPDLAIVEDRKCQYHNIHRDDLKIMRDSGNSQ